MTNKAGNHIGRVIKGPSASQNQEIIDLLQQILDQAPDEVIAPQVGVTPDGMPVFMERQYDADAGTVTTTIIDHTGAEYTGDISPTEKDDLVQLESAGCVCVDGTQTTLKRWQIFKHLNLPTQEGVGILFTDSVTGSIVPAPAAGTFSEGACSVSSSPTSIGNESYTSGGLNAPAGAVYAVGTVTDGVVWFRLDGSTAVIGDSHRAAAGQNIYLQIEDEINDFDGVGDPSCQIHWTYYDKALILT